MVCSSVWWHSQQLNFSYSLELEPMQFADAEIVCCRPTRSPACTVAVALSLCCLTCTRRSQANGQRLFSAGGRGMLVCDSVEVQSCWYLATLVATATAFAGADVIEFNQAQPSSCVWIALLTSSVARHRVYQEPVQSTVRSFIISESHSRLSFLRFVADKWLYEPRPPPLCGVNVNTSSAARERRRQG